MAYQLTISKWVAKFPLKYVKAATSILMRMADLKRQGSYTEFMPLDYSNPQNQKFVGEVLWYIWTECHDLGLPPLNFLVGRADLDLLPSTDGGIGKWYEFTFKTLKGFEMYCELNAQMAATMLRDGIIVIEE